MSFSMTCAVGAYVVVTARPVKVSVEVRKCPFGHGDNPESRYCPECGALIESDFEVVDMYDMEQCLSQLNTDMCVTWFEAYDVGLGDYSDDVPPLQLAVVLSGVTIDSDDVDPVDIDPVNDFSVSDAQLEHMREVFAEVSEVKTGILCFTSS